MVGKMLKEIKWLCSEINYVKIIWAFCQTYSHAIGVYIRIYNLRVYVSLQINWEAIYKRQTCYLERYLETWWSVVSMLVIFASLYLIVSLLISNLLACLLLRYHKTVLPINRNILTHLNSFLVISINVCTTVLVSGNIISQNIKYHHRVWVFYWGYFVGPFISILQLHAGQ